MKCLKQLVKGSMGSIRSSLLLMLSFHREFVEGQGNLAHAGRPKKETLVRTSLSLSTIRATREPLLPSTLSQILRRQGVCSGVF